MVQVVKAIQDGTVDGVPDWAIRPLRRLCNSQSQECCEVCCGCEDSRGRPFYNCAKPRGEQCKVFDHGHMKTPAKTPVLRLRGGRNIQDEAIGRTYYRNTVSGTSVWDVPKEEAKEAAAKQVVEQDPSGPRPPVRAVLGEAAVPDEECVWAVMRNKSHHSKSHAI